MKRLGQNGFLHLHVIVPVVLALVAVGAVGSYVLSKSGASSDTSIGYNTCGTIKKDGKVYAATVGSQAKFVAAKNNDSVRNIAYGLCKQGYLDTATAQHANSSGDYEPELQKAYARMQIATSVESSGIPTKASLVNLQLTPVGF